MKMNWMDKLAWLVVIIGALNWGLVGFFRWDLVEKIFGSGNTGATRVVYCVVGLFALWSVWTMLAMSGGSRGKDKSA